MGTQILVFEPIFHNMLYAVLAGIGIFIVVNIYVFILIRNRYIKQLLKKNEELIEANIKLIESEQHLQKTNAAKDKLFSIIAHDLRNPFNALLGLTEVLSNNAEKYNVDKLKQYAGIINSSAKNMHIQLENLLEWSRSQRDLIEFKPDTIHFRPLVLNVFTLLEINAYNKNIDLICEVNNDTWVNADKNIISSVCRNLIDNAIKYTKEGGKVIVSSKKIDNFVEISVADTGIGLKKEELRKIFRLESNFTKKGTNNEKGTGLGLILCKEFVEMNGGEIGVSSSLGKGSIFKFTLPIDSNIKIKSQ